METQAHEQGGHYHREEGSAQPDPDQTGAQEKHADIDQGHFGDDQGQDAGTGAQQTREFPNSFQDADLGGRYLEHVHTIVLDQRPEKVETEIGHEVGGGNIPEKGFLFHVGSRHGESGCRGSSPAGRVKGIKRRSASICISGAGSRVGPNQVNSTLRSKSAALLAAALAVAMSMMPALKRSIRC